MYNKDEDVNRICKDDRALHSESLPETAIPARRERKHETQEERSGNTILLETYIKGDEQGRNEQQLFQFYT